jgi:NAD(P)-dependent dehydrogenase (short-subunit alcohol dehydrogenase family)
VTVVARRVCVVTGAASGLGRATAEAFAADGDRVVVIDRDRKRGDATATEIGELRGDGSVVFEHVDVGDEDAVAGLAERLAERFGAVDVLVNNAGIALREGSVATLTRRQWDLTLRVNLTSVYLMSHALIPLMPRGSSIVNVSTTGALRAVPGTDAYLAAKGGVIALSKAMAVSLADHGIRVNVVCPGVVLTDEVATRVDDPRVQAMVARAGAPLGRGFGQPPEFAAVVRFLCSAEASFVNGAVLSVDGGGLS